MFRSLTFKLTVVILGVLILSNAGQTLRLLSDFGSVWASRQEQIAEEVLDRARSGQTGTGLERGVLREIAAEGPDPGALRLYDGEGRLVDWLGKLQGHPEISREAFEPLRDLPAGRPRRLRKLVDGLAFGLRLDTGPEGPVRFLVYSQPREQAPWLAAFQRLARRNLLVSTIIASLAGLFLVRWLRRRLKGLDTAFKRMAAGDLSARVPEPKERELASLARSFNAMAADLERAQAERRSAEEERRLFMAQASHELRTPLTAMQGYLETLTMEGLDLPEADRRRYLDRAFLEAQELGHRVEDLVELVRLERPGFQLAPSEVELSAVFEELARRYEPLAASAGVELKGLAQPPCFTVRWDRRRVVQALGNLLHNAIKASARGGAVQVEAAVEGEDVRIAVIDQGPGLSGYDDPSGLGLGLKIAHLLTEKHAGTLRLEAAEPQGLRAVVTLPREASL